MSPKYAAIRAAFDLLSLSGATGIIRRRSRCKGVIFTLHRVLADPPAAFSPNAILQVRPDFLAYCIERVRALGLETVSLDEAIRRIQSDRPEKPFAVFTFDDAYRDNLTTALPILDRLRCPFTLYVPTALVDGAGEVWWQALEDIIAAQQTITVSGEGGAETFDCSTQAGKQKCYDALYAHMRRMPEPQRVLFIRDLARRYGYDLEGQCRSLIMNWGELRQIAAHPLCTIGAHTVHHYELAKLPEAEAKREILRSAEVLEARLGSRPQHLSYPIGSVVAAGPREYAIAQDLGFRSGVTTRPGGLYSSSRQQLLCLPRISLNGLFQQRRYVDVFATGAVFNRIPAA